MELACQPLACPSCGGLVPLGEGASARCPFCSADVPVPAEHVALREAGRALEADRLAARERYLEIAVAPRWVQALARAAQGIAIVAIGLLPVFLVFLDLGSSLVAAVLRALAPLFGVDLIDRFGWMPTMAAIGLGFYVTLLVPVALSRYADAFESARKLLLSAYAARPPSAPSGPSTCRNCGAALDLERGDLVTVCVYCQAHNLVDVSTEKAAAAKGRAVEVRRKIDAAVASLASLRAEGRRAVRSTFKVAATMVIPFSLPLLGVLVSGKERDGADTVPDWTTSYRTPRQIIPYTGKMISGSNATGWPIGEPHGLGMSRCKEASCSRTFYVALDAGERLTLVSPKAKDVEITSERNGPKPVRHPVRWTRQGEGGSAVFVQPRYRSFAVITVKVPRAERDAMFTWSVAR